jgi:hypothetical protein
MSIFDKVPDEIISRIITVGCDMADLTEERLPYSFYASEKPIPYLFAANSRVVCHRWHAIVHTRSNAHMWAIHAYLAHPDTHNERSTLAKFQSRLSSSNGCDIYVDYQTVAKDEQTISSDSFEIRTLVLLMKLIKPYRLHIASLNFWLRSNITGLGTQLVRDLGFCPRLHSIQIYCDLKDNAGLLDEDGEFGNIASSALALHWPDEDRLSTLGGEAEKTRDSTWSKPDRVEFWMSRTSISDQTWGFFHGQLRSVEIGGEITLSWSNFEQLMIGCPLLRHLDISISRDVSASAFTTADNILFIKHHLDSLRLGLQDATLLSRILGAFRLPNLKALAIHTEHRSPSDTVRFHNLPDVAYANMSNAAVETPSSSGLVPSLRSLRYDGIHLQDWETLYRAIGEGPQIEKLGLSFKEEHEWSPTRHQQHLSSEPFCRTPVSATFTIRGSPARLLTVLYATNLRGTTHLMIEVLGTGNLINPLEEAVLYMPLLAEVYVRADVMSHAMQIVRHLASHVYSATESTTFRIEDGNFTSATLYLISLAANDPNNLRSRKQPSRLDFTIRGSSNSTGIFDYQDSLWTSPMLIEVTDVLITWERPSNIMVELAHAFQIFTGSPGADVPLPYLQHLDFYITSGEFESACVRAVSSERYISFFNAMADARLRQKVPLARFRMYVDGKNYVKMLRDAHSGLLIPSSLEDDDVDEG